MKNKYLGLGIAFALMSGLPNAVFATSVSSITFTYDCTIDGTGQTGTGTNSCAGGQTIAQVRISNTGNNYSYSSGSSNILQVDARLQFFDPNPPSNQAGFLGYQLDAIWLNINEALLGSSAGNTEGQGTSGIAFHDGNGNGANDFNYIWFDKATSSGNFDGIFNTQIEVAKDSTDANSWHNFDFGLCDDGQNPANCALDLPVMSDPNQDPNTMAWVTLGFLNSGTLYDLSPTDFNFKTTHPTPPGDTGLINPAANSGNCGWVDGELASAIKVDPRATSSLFGNTTCDSGSSYGPRYGASKVTIPAPATLALTGTGLLGLAFARRRVGKS